MTFGRPHSKDYEYIPATSETMIRISMIHLMLKTTRERRFMKFRRPTLRHEGHEGGKMVPGILRVLCVFVVHFFHSRTLR